MENKRTRVKGEARVDLLNQLAFSYWSKDPRKGVEFGLEALALGERLDYRKGMARALNCIGLNWWVQGNYASALSYYYQALEISRLLGDKTSQSNTLNNMGKLYNDLGRNDLALEHYFQTLRIKEELKDTYGMARVMNNIGEVYLELKRYDEALGFFKKSLAMKSGPNGDREGQATAHLNIGEIYRAREKPALALEQFRESLRISTEIGKNSGVGESLYGMAEIYLAENNAGKALDSLSRALKIREGLGDKKGVAGCLNRMGSAYILQGDFPAAQGVLNKALKIAEEISSKTEMIRSWETLSDLHAAQQDFSRSLHFFKKYAQLKDQVYTEQSNQKIANLSILYENQQKGKEIEVQRLKLEKQRQVGYLFIIIIVLALLVIFFIANRFRLKAKVNRELERMNSRLDLLTRTDPLTMLSNRRDFIEKVNYESARFLRSRSAFAIVMGDIDDFKKINDLHGHECGDAVLVTIARLIREAIREQDIVARWGGEEFILLLPETDTSGSKVISERICRKIAAHVFEHQGEPLSISMTFGVAAFSEGMKIDDCIARADKAMYQGKFEGKNRVILYNA